MSDKGFTTIPDWMLSLDLDIYEVIILAVIYGFSQDGESSFTGSQNYLAWKAKCSRAKVARALPRLVEMGLIHKKDVTIRGVNLCEYRVCLSDTGCISRIQGVVSPGDTINYNDNIDIKERDNKGRSRFQKPSLEEVTAFCRERMNSIDPEEFFAFYESKGWMVGKSPMKDWKAAVITWEKSAKKRSTQGQSKPQPKKKSVYANNLQVIDEMYGTNLYEQAYGHQQPDEQ